MIKLLKNVFIIFIVSSLLVCTVLWFEYKKIQNDSLNVDAQGVTFTIRKGANLLDVSRQLNEEGITTISARVIYLYARLNDKAHRIKAGEYLIVPNTTIAELINKFVAGKVVQHSFTIIEGTTAQQLLDAVIADDRLVKTIKDSNLSELMLQLGQPDTNSEGQFLPETYYFPAGTTDIEFLARAHQHLVDVLQKAWSDRAENLPYKSAYEALIMASIIEKETGIAEERAQIAGVFVRRLQKGMRLQTDPTVIYGLGDDYTGNIRKKHLRTDTPYNTYTRHGLPPTPIALASKESITAALHPASGDSLYFVATGIEGRHVFSSTLKAHNKAVRKYQLKK